jgi:hypothetical protein
MISLSNLLKNKPLLMEITVKEFRQSISGDRYKPFSSSPELKEKYKKYIQLMTNPDTSQDVKDKITNELIERNLQLISQYWFNGYSSIPPFKVKFSHIDDENYLQIAYDKIIQLAPQFDWGGANQFGAFYGRSLYHALINANVEPSEKPISSIGKDDGEMSGEERLSNLSNSLQNENPFLSDVFLELQKSPEFQQKVENLYNDTNNNTKKLLLKWWSSPVLTQKFKDLAKLVKAHNDAAPNNQLDYRAVRAQIPNVRNDIFKDRRIQAVLRDLI